MSATIHVIDDDEQVRESLGLLLETLDHKVLTFASGDAHIAEAPDLNDVIVILDIRMPGRDGLETLAEIRQRSDQVPVIMISGHGDIPLAVRAMQLGANNFVEKPFVASRILAAIDAATQAETERDDPLDCLTPREREVAMLLIDGKPNKIVAHELGMSVRTVETHRARIKSKLGISSLTDLVRLALGQ